MTAEPQNTGFVPEATICCTYPLIDNQLFIVANRTHGVYRVYQPQSIDRFEGERVLARDDNGRPIAFEGWTGDHHFCKSLVLWKKDLADVGEYDPAYTRRSGIERRKEFVFDAKQIADDICKEINSNGPGDASFFGVFVCAGESPTEQELENAKKRLVGYFMQTIAAADAQWSNNPKHDLISGIAKRAARYLNLDPEDHEWMSNYQQTVACPACGTRIRAGVAICKGCGAILDQEKAARFGLIQTVATGDEAHTGHRPKSKSPSQKETLASP